LLYCPAETISILKDGENYVKINAEGFNEWFVAHASMVLGFAKPKNGRIIVFSSDGTVTYDSAVDSGDVYVARGDYIECAGVPKDVFTLKAKSVSAGERR
jgi:phosphatidate phosphatase PAH1